MPIVPPPPGVPPSETVIQTRSKLRQGCRPDRSPTTMPSATAHVAARCDTPPRDRRAFVPKQQHLATLAADLRAPITAIAPAAPTCGCRSGGCRRWPGKARRADRPHPADDRAAGDVCTIALVFLALGWSTKAACAVRNRSGDPAVTSWDGSSVLTTSCATPIRCRSMALIY